MQRRLRVDACNQAEVGVVDIQDGSSGLRMVEDIQCVHTELHALGLTDPDRFAEIRVKPPLPGPFHGPLAQNAAASGQGILQKNPTGRGIRDRVECAYALEVLQR